MAQAASHSEDADCRRRKLLTVADFELALQQDVLGVVQPDMAKRGGLTECGELAREILGKGRRSVRTISAEASDCLRLRISSPRSAVMAGSRSTPMIIPCAMLCGLIVNAKDGTIELNQNPGLGIEADFSAIERYPSIWARKRGLSASGTSSRLRDPMTSPEA
ncbi:enolase C-terminal domain-like protein [Bradyrhizobium guangdongense]